MSTTKQLYQAMATALSVPVTSISEELEYQSIPEWDSITHLVVVQELESAFNIAIEMKDVLEMGSVAKIRELLKKYDVQLS